MVRVTRARKYNIRRAACYELLPWYEKAAFAFRFWPIRRGEHVWWRYDEDVLWRSMGHPSGSRLCLRCRRYIVNENSGGRGHYTMNTPLPADDFSSPMWHGDIAPARRENGR